MLSQDQRIEIADRIKFDLLPAGSTSWRVTELLDGIADPAISEPGDLRAVVHILARDHGISANLVNSLWFRNENGEVTNAEEARRYLPQTVIGRPPAGVRVQGDTDDPFAVATAISSARRAAIALPRAAARLAQHTEAGRFTEGAVTMITAAAHDRATEETTAELAGVVRQMLPNGNSRSRG
jgi:hypothetical protein